MTPKYIQSQGLKIALVCSYLRVSQAAGQVKILIFLVEIILCRYMPIIFVMQGKFLFSDISRPESMSHLQVRRKTPSEYYGLI